MGEEKKSSFANQAYVAAEKALKEAHKVEFEALLDAEYEKAGVARKRRLSAEERAKKVAEEKAAKEAAKKAAEREKAQATLDALLATYPDLQPTSALADLADEVA